MIEPLDYEDAWLFRILKDVKTIAMVGASTNWNRPSYFVMKYLQGKGYRVIPVNPMAAGQELLGETIYADLQSVPDQYDMVDIFRNSEAAAVIANEAISLREEKGTQVIWMQLTVRHDEAAAKCEKAGLRVVMDRCPKIEYGRLFGELGWAGINSGVITSKRLK